MAASLPRVAEIPICFHIIDIPGVEGLECKPAHRRESRMSDMANYLGHRQHFLRCIQREQLLIISGARTPSRPFPIGWSLPSVPDVVIGLDHQDFISVTFSSTLERRPYLNTILIRLPRADLLYTEWVGTPTLQELCRLFVGGPKITMIMITNARARWILCAR
ncbi:hypothetical protein HYDPIDRAFT_110992 [Hydnomerulius pinastri MD-312]|uniref:Uncharacterized protein n=1 Tax=Hydnomerulius pinastri MD-312 TaxID=994086 RepID=A0A0C9WGA6_9AGAM|nr:hypothetical protein HYDPIDRAFT_110992 [Hydnomerulius pinastri MD-312]